MTTSIIITLTLLLIVAYVFDLTASKTKIPSVILLLSVGMGLSRLSNYFTIQIPDLNSVLPVLGTIGLILIVFEGSLELDVDKTKIPIITKTILFSVLSILCISLVLAYVLSYYFNENYVKSLVNALPLAIISSAIAIPSVSNLSAKVKEFVTYESSLSDIFGVLIFNFFTINQVIDFEAFLTFGLDIFIIIVITVLISLFLTYLLSKIKHHVKFLPILLMLILIYNVAKIWHLPSLIIILLYGIFLGNINKISFLGRFINSEILQTEIVKLRELNTEFAFLIRALFFLLFGFLINFNELVSLEALVWALGICSLIYLSRFLLLKLFKLELKPFLFIAPRGLITILLLLSIPDELKIVEFTKSIFIQVIVLSAVMMMFGMIFSKNKVSQVGE